MYLKRLTEVINEREQMTAAASESSAAWMSSLRSQRTRGLPNPALLAGLNLH
jgi:hypothetical protein